VVVEAVILLLGVSGCNYRSSESDEYKPNAIRLDAVCALCPVDSAVLDPDQASL
jgi:hypothetical protein